MAIRYLSGINVDSNTLFVDDANNRVGIGTASPTQALDVTGRAYISSGASIGTTSTAGTGLTVNGSTVLLSFVEIQQGNLLYLYSSGNTYYSQIYQSGQNLILSPHSNVGIGTTSPSTKLEVVGGSVNTQIARFITADYPTHSVGLGVDAQSTYWGASIFQDDVKRFTVDSTGGILVGGNYQGSDAPANGAAIEGSVGIGTTSPSTKLDVIGTGVFGTMTTSRGSYSNGLSLQNNGGQATSLFLWQSGVASAHIGSPANSTSLHIVNSYNTGLITDPNAIVLDNTGNVGIGTTSPSSKLQSNTSSTYNSATPSGAIIASNLSGGNAIIDIGVDTSYLGYIQSRNILNTTAYNLLLNPIGGNVGIGTTSPNGALHVASSPQTRVVIENTGNDANGAGLIMTVRSSGTIVGNGGIYVDNSNNLILYNGGVYAGNERVRINNSGYVGINTTAPSSFLTVSPGGSGNAATFTSGANLSTNYVGITLNSVTTSGVEWYGSEIRNINTGGTPGFLNPRLGFFTQNASTYLPADRTEKMSILGNGNVGIGTTSPGFRLDVVGSDSAVARIYTTNSAQTISIGSTNQTQYTDIILPTDDGQGEIFRAGSGYSSYGGVRALNIWNSNGPIAFHPNNTGNVMYLSTTGNVGIGTTSPSQKLEVSGNAKVTGVVYTDVVATNSGTAIDFRDQAAASIMYLDAPNKRVGIGTTSPSVALHTNGFIRSANSGNTVYTEVQNDGLYATGTDLYLLAPSTKFISFYAGGAERMRISSAGALKLNAYGSGSKTGTVAYNLAVDSSGNIIETAGGVVDGSGTANYVTKWIDGNTVGNSLIYDDGTTITFQTGASERMRITSDGNVAINSTTTSGYRLYVNGSTWINGGTNFQDGVSIFRTESGAAEVMRIASNGNVGIGTTTPANRLQIGSVGSSGFGGNDIVIGNGTQVMAFYQSSTVSTWYTNTNFALMPSGVGATGNVGIGTTSPGAKLHVSGGEIRVDAGQAITLDVSNNMYLVGASNQLRLYNGANPVVNITTAGNVGIGTTSPGSLLHVYGATPTVKIQGTGTASSKIDLVGPYTVWTLENQYINGATNDMFRIYNSELGADAITINRLSNNVGIGTTSPSEKLDVYGAIKLSGQVANVVTNGIVHHTNGYVYFTGGTAGAAMGNDSYSSAIYVVDNGSLELYAGSSNRLHITSAGNVGIGTTSPSYKLDVNGATQIQNELILSTNDAAFRLYRTTGINYFDWSSGQDLRFSTVTTIGGAGRSTAVTFLSDGNVGIGTTSPSFKLDVNGNTRIGGNSGSNTARLNVGGAANEWVADFQASTTTNQSYGLVVRAGTSSTDFPFYVLDSSSSTAFFAIKGNGNVGIGTTSPSQKLHVNGVIEAGPASTSGGPMIYQSYNSSNYIGSIGSEYSSGAMLIGYGATGKNGASGYVSTFSNFPGIRGLIKLASGEFSILSSISAVQTAVGGDLTMTTNFIVTNEGNVGIGTTSPSQALHVSGNVRVTGAYYDSSNSAGSSGQVLSSTGSGTAWVNQGEATATSLYDLLPAARTTYAWSVQLTAGTWEDIFSSNTVLSNGTWMVQAYVSDFAVGGQQYQETYSGVMSWGNASSTNETGPEAISEIILHRSGHAANSGNFYLRTVERPSSTLLFQGMSNQTYSAASTINFKFVKIF